MAPTAGTFGHAAGAATIAPPAGIVSGDLEFIAVESANSTTAAGAPATPAGWTKVFEQTSGAGATGVSTLTIFAKLATGAESNITLTGSLANHSGGTWTRVPAAEHSVTNVATQLTVGTADAATTGNGAPSSITVAANSLILFFCASTRDAANTANFSAWTATNPATFTEIADEVTTDGAGGGIGIAYGTCTGTSTGAGSVTIGASAQHVAVLIGLPGAAPSTAALDQKNFRIRTDDSIALNTDSGWAAALNTNATIDAEIVFRIRFEVEAGATSVVTGGLKLRYSRNGGGYIDMPVSDSIAAPNVVEAVEIVPSASFTADAATTNLLAGSSNTFEAGVGSHDNATPTQTLQNEHTEVEYAIRIRKTYGTFANGSLGENLDGDTFAFRLETATVAFATYSQTPTITLNIPNNLIGGSFVETPKKLGPFTDGNSAIYAIIEAADTNPRLLIEKSTDSGVTWIGKDIANSPSRRDLEAIDAVYAANELFIAHQQTSNVSFHSFRTSSNASPDTWNTKNEDIDTSLTTNGDQMVGLVRRSGGTFVCVYESDLASAQRQLSYKIRSTVPAWGTRVTLDSTASTAFTDASIVVGASDLIYIFYLDYTNGTVYYKTLSTGDVLSARTSVATGLTTSGTANRERPIVPSATYYDDAGTEKILIAYRKSDGNIYSKLMAGGVLGAELQATTEGVLVDPSGTTNRMPVASLAVYQKNAYLIYADATTSDLWVRESADGAAWSAATEIRDSVLVEFVSSMPFSTNIGYFFDDNAGGHTGNIKFGSFAATGVSAGGAMLDPMGMSGFFGA